MIVWTIILKKTVISNGAIFSLCYFERSDFFSLLFRTERFFPFVISNGAIFSLYYFERSGAEREIYNRQIDLSFRRDDKKREIVST
ncbi:MAG: hypothetical protein COX43_03505 [Parcubacteria group bacterium CG23_combo_of_CG06-09_8_20_14_all_35_9]|nr:MAG: hypothetical protein COX43_03505 [Parcubacteria group bacterium CG23_combo_of_CG06-09_8_20_14_all_35_9]